MFARAEEASQQLRRELSEERAARESGESASQEIRTALDEERAARADVEVSSQQLCLELERVRLEAEAAISEAKVKVLAFAPPLNCALFR